MVSSDTSVRRAGAAIAAVLALHGCTSKHAGTGTGVATTAGAGTGGATPPASSASSAATAASSASGASTSGTGGAAGTGGGSGGMPVETESVLQRGKHATRDGAFVEPALTHVAAATLAKDPSFVTSFQGNVYAQPLYLENGPGGVGIFIVVTEEDLVFAFSEVDGSTVWMATVGTPAQKTGAGCGNITPLGITGTPVIDAVARTLYLDAVVADPSAPDTIKTHEVHALSVDDGSERPGFPFDVSTISAGGVQLDPIMQNQRGALLLLDGTLYVPYGGHNGDCGTYYGWVVGVPVADPQSAKAFVTGTRGGGIWAPGGLASDGTYLFATTGNTFGATGWAQGEALLRFLPGPSWSGLPADYFSPSNWDALDVGDLDFGATHPIVVDLPGSTPSALLVAQGKNGVAYLLDRDYLGGIGTGNGTTGEGLSSVRLTSGQLVGVSASYQTPLGRYVVSEVNASAPAIGCPDGTSGDLVAFRILPGSPPSLAIAWCANNQGQGSPIATTTDGTSDALVWTIGVGNSNRLHAYDGDTGALVYTGGGPNDTITSLRYWSTPIAAKGRVLAVGASALYAFKPQ